MKRSDGGMQKKKRRRNDAGEERLRFAEAAAIRPCTASCRTARMKCGPVATICSTEAVDHDDVEQDFLVTGYRTSAMRRYQFQSIISTPVAESCGHPLGRVPVDKMENNARRYHLTSTVLLTATIPRDTSYRTYNQIALYHSN